MSARRRNGNAIRGPQSALTDFLASHNISAVQIRHDYERRRRDAEQQAESTTASGDPSDNQPPEPTTLPETTENKKKRKRKQDATIAKIKKSKEYQRRKVELAGEPGEDDDDDIAFDIYAKSKPLPGQLENCENCEKRFTVTPYSKTGPDGGLLCTKCSKAQEEERKREAKAKKGPTVREKRRKVQSNLLDGIISRGAKSLLEHCVEKVADKINDIDEFGDLPPALLNRLSQILCKRRVLSPRTLDLFLRSDVDTVAIYDCAKLETDDYIRIFTFVPKVETLDLRYAGQLKDSVIDCMIERKVSLRSLRLDGANLVSDGKWREYFDTAGYNLESLELSWLDYAFDAQTVQHLIAGCPRLRHLKLKRCFHLGDDALELFAQLTNMESLSLTFMAPTTSANLTNLVRNVGQPLHKLCLRRFQDADDSLLEAIHHSCTNLSKLAITENDRCSDAGFAALFDQWSNPPLCSAMFSSNREVDNATPEESGEVIGFASAGFLALMNHSGKRLEKLNISSCRQIAREALSTAFDGKKQYPALADIDLSFVCGVDTTVVAGIFKSCPALKKVAAFGCFDVRDVVVPSGVALIGVPTAQDSIVQEGVSGGNDFVFDI